MDESPILGAALRYAANGIAVFPSRLYVRGDGRKGVNPIRDWDEASTTDEATIRAWFTGAWSDAALCIDCGKSGIVGVDQDVTEGKNGIEEWEKLDHAPTYRVRSPSGGAHDYYRADPEHPFTVDNTGAVADGVDIRGMGGFLFAPPSIDPRGGAWQWVISEPNWADLPMVPEVVIKRMELAAARKRAKASPSVQPALTSGATPATSDATSQLFTSGGADFGPGGGYKKETAARALLSARLDEFLSRTEEGSSRSHFLAQDLGVLAGHGVGVFWTYEDALDTLMDACRENGFAATNGEGYALQQAQRGLEYGMREPWVRAPEDHPTIDQVVARGSDGDAVDELLAEMLKPSEVIAKPPPRPLVRGLLNLDSESWIIGAPGSKKSFVATDIAGHVAIGRTWQGMRVTQARVVMVVAEGAGGLGPRLQAWQAEHGVTMSDEIFILPRPVQAAELEKWAVLIEACRRIGPGLVVLDTQARVTVGLEENSAKEMGIFIEAVRAIREATGACVLTVHHTGRAGGDARGSSAIDGAQHSELKVVAEKGVLRGKLISEKQKDMPLAPDVELVFAVHEVGRDEDDEPITSLALVSDAFKKLAGQSEEAPKQITAAPSFEISKWVDRMLTVLVKDGPSGVGLTRADVMKQMDVLWSEDKGKTPARDWRVTKEAWKALADDDRTERVPGGQSYEVVDLETRDRIESELGRNSRGQELGSNDR